MLTNRVKDEYKKFGSILVGNLLITFCYACITVPNRILNGGITSFSMVMGNILGIETVYLVNIITLLLLVLCYYQLGKDYFFGSIFSCISYLILFNIFSKTGFTVNFPKIVSVLIAAAGVGAGYYFCIAAKATTVGFDVIALILSKKKKKLNMAYAMAVINLIVMLSGGFTFGIWALVYGSLFVGVQSFVLNQLQKISKKTGNE